MKRVCEDELIHNARCLVDPILDGWSEVRTEAVLVYHRDRIIVLREALEHLATLTHSEEPEPDDTDLDPFPEEER